MTERGPDSAGPAGVPSATGDAWTPPPTAGRAAGGLSIHGFPLPELAERCRTEHVAWLLHRGELPDADELAEFEAEERALRRLPDEVRAVIDALPVDAEPMEVLGLAIAALPATRHEQPDRAAPHRRSVQLFAVLPAVVAYDQRRRRGQALIPPRNDLDHCRNLLWMTLGEEPTDVEADVLRVAMILHAEQDDAARIAAREVADATGDLDAAVLGAIEALRDPSQGRGSEAVLRLFHEVAVPDAIDERLNAALAADEPIAGFGPHGDDRVAPMRAALTWLVAAREAYGLAELSLRLETAIRERTGLLPDLAYPTAPALGLLGFDAWTFAPLLVPARIAGWTAQAIERLTPADPIRTAPDRPEAARRHVPGPPISLFPSG